MLYVFLYHTPNPEKLQVFSHFPHKIHPKSGTNPHFLTTPPSPPLTPGSPTASSHSQIPTASSPSPTPGSPSGGSGRSKRASRGDCFADRRDLRPGSAKSWEKSCSPKHDFRRPERRKPSGFLRELSRCRGFAVPRTLDPALRFAVRCTPPAAAARTPCEKNFTSLTHNSPLP